MRFVLTSILTFFVLTNYAQQELVKKRTATDLLFYTTDKGKAKTQKQIDYYILYDKQGREIEYVSFGEYRERQVIGKDNSISWYCSQDYSKINSVDFSTYDTMGRKVKEETWFYKDNKKNWTSGYTIFKYNGSGLLLKEIRYSAKDTVEKTITYIYNINSDNTEIIDSSFTSGKISVYKTENLFDTLKRITLTTEYSNGKLLLRRKFLYRDGTDNITELRYDNASDTSLWSITETKIGYIRQFPYPKKKLEKFWKVINSTAETREVYLYNKNCLPDKIEIYSGITLTGYTKFDYEYY